VRVVVVDDHPMIVDGLRAALGVPGVEVVGSAASVSEALTVVGARKPDVVVMDVQLPDGSGLDATPAILREHPGTGVLVLSMTTDDDAVEAALAAGVGGYLAKGASREEIVRAVRAVADGQLILGSDVAGHVLHVGPTASPFPELTVREREVLDLVARGEDNPTIGRRLGMSAKTAANHVSAILTKLGVADRTQAALLARDRTARGFSGRA